MEGTALAKMYKAGEYTPPSQGEYVDLCCYVLTHVNPKIIIHRLTGDCPRDLLVAPEWNKNKSDTINKIVMKMQFENLRQGIYWQKM
jgi:radical SAM superfamily enzyme